ncbi:MAG: nickel pincer cofactor biosynthesis protein LarC [Candidatus Helarchaeota archaeon]
MRVVIVDCSIAGVSGDMFLAALIDAGANAEKLIELANYLKLNFEELRDIKIKNEHVNRKGIKSTVLKIELEEDHLEKTPQKLFKILNKALSDFKVSSYGREIANKILDKIINAECKVHGKNIDAIHLHETGSFDTIFDIVGVIILTEDLKILQNTVWFGLPLVVGGGKVTFSHGTYSVPAPATTEILKQAGYKIMGGPIDKELATPTGTAILTTLIQDQVDFLPEIRIESVGYGAGNNDFKEIPNVLRIIIGNAENIATNWEWVSVLETNVDDVSGELLGNLIENIMKEGRTKDISIIPTITKKNRPGYIIKIITDLQNEDFNLNYLMKETGTLGVRVNRIKRKVLNRKTIKKEVQINGKKFEIPIKISYDKFGIVNFKPEFEDVKKVAKELGKPFRIILKEINERLNENDFV